MLTALVLICSLALTPDLSACNRDNASDVILVPVEFGNPVACLMQAQAYVAQTTIGRELDADERIKVVCTPGRTVASTRPATLR